MPPRRQPAPSGTDVLRPSRPVRSRSASRSSRSSAGSANSRRAGVRTSAPSRSAATPAARSLDRAQEALDQAAKTEKELRASLKEHGEAVTAARHDLDKR